MTGVAQITNAPLLSSSCIVIESGQKPQRWTFAHLALVTYSQYFTVQSTWVELRPIGSAQIISQQHNHPANQVYCLRSHTHASLRYLATRPASSFHGFVQRLDTGDRSEWRAWSRPYTRPFHGFVESSCSTCTLHGAKRECSGQSTFNSSSHENTFIRHTTT